MAALGFSRRHWLKLQQRRLFEDMTWRSYEDMTWHPYEDMTRRPYESIIAQRVTFILIILNWEKMSQKRANSKLEIQNRTPQIPQKHEIVGKLWGRRGAEFPKTGYQQAGNNVPKTGSQQAGNTRQSPRNTAKNTKSSVNWGKCLKIGLPG